MARQEEQPPELLDDANAKNELFLDNWKLVLIFFVGLVICTIFFAAGLIVGRHQPRVAESIPATSLESLRTYSTPSPTNPVENRFRPPTAAPPRQTVVDINPPSPVAAKVADTPSIETITAPSTTLVGTAEATPPAAETVGVESKLKAAASPDVPRPSAQPGGAFRVQVAAMKTMAEAQAVVDKLNKKGFEAFVVPPKGASDVYYRVQVGDFTDRAAAQELILKLQQAGERPVLKRQQP